MANADPPPSPVTQSDALAAANLPAPTISPRDPHSLPFTASNGLDRLKTPHIAHNDIPATALCFANETDDTAPSNPQTSDPIDVSHSVSSRPSDTPITSTTGHRIVTASNKRQKTGTSNSSIRRALLDDGVRRNIVPKRKSTDSSILLNRKALINNGFIQFARMDALKPPTIPAVERDAYDKMFSDFEAKYKLQCQHRWEYVKNSDSEYIESIGLGTRSSNLDEDEEAISLQTTSRRRLTRYHMEDSLLLSEGDELILYFAKSAVSDQSRWWNKSFPLSSIVDIQQSETFKMMGTEYVKLRATVSQAKMNVDARNGDLSLAEFKSSYGGVGQGITVTFHVPDSCKTTFKLSIAWRYLIDDCGDFHLYGSPLNKSRNYGDFFKNKRDRDTIRHIFFTLAPETFGDFGNSQMLFIEYQKAMITSLSILLSKANSKLAKIEVSNFKETPDGWPLLEEFDKVCENAFRNTISGWNDYNQSIIVLSTIDSFAARAQKAFPTMWKHLKAIRYLGNKHMNKRLTAIKNRQIFMLICELARQRNPKNLTWWALIYSMSFFVSGVPAHVQNIASGWGIALSRPATNVKFKDLLLDISHSQRRLLKDESIIVAAIDNYQRTANLKEMRGGRSSCFYHGTNEQVELPRPYNPTTTTIPRQPQIMYNLEQPYISPDGMAAYELCDRSHPSSFFINHAEMPSASTIDVSGNRIYAYMNDWLGPSEYMLDIQSYISCSSYFEEEFYPSNLNSDCINRFCDIAGTRDAKVILKHAANFRNEAVLKWNPHNFDVTLTNWLGLIGINEARCDATGAIVIDLMARTGMLDEDNLHFKLASDIKDRWMIMFGDVKTVDNINLIQDMIQKTNARGSLSDNSDQLRVFQEALDKVCDVPGDWHAGMAMLQAIFHLFYRGFLNQFQYQLEWKRIYSDVRKCYYQASRLVIFMNRMIGIMLFQQFIQKLDGLIAKFGNDGNNGDFMYFIATEFHLWLKSFVGGDDQWLSTCASFMLMSNDFIRFVRAYRSGDSIAIEQGYQIFCPIFRLNGQHRYYNRHWSQLEMLFEKCNYRLLQIIRRSRCTCRYSNPHKGQLAKDECVEIGNYLLSKLPTPKDVANFAEKSVFAGPGRKCTLFTRMWNTKVSDENDDITPSARMKFNEADEKCAFELLSYLGTSQIVQNRKFDKNFVNTQRKNVKTSIKDKKIEDRIKQSASDGASHLISTMRQCFDENRATSTQVIVTESVDKPGHQKEAKKELDVELEDSGESSINEIDEDAEREVLNVDLPEPKDDDRANIEKDGMNLSCVTDIWSRGKQLVLKDNVAEMRRGQLKRQKRKRKKLVALRKHLESQQTNVSDCRINEEMATVESVEVKSYKHILQRYSFYGSCYINSS